VSTQGPRAKGGGRGRGFPVPWAPGSKARSKSKCRPNWAFFF
jgi:hypothetical protein